MSSNPSNGHQKMEVDALIVGAGFGGVNMLNSLRKLGLSAKIFEAGDDMDLPIYQLTTDELWKDWNWKEKFPGWKELREYFHYLDKKLDLTRDVVFNSHVVSAEWDSAVDKWTVKTRDGKVAVSRYLLLCTGIGSKPYVPAFKGLDTFRGISYHSARWPQSGVNFDGKKVGVIGTGATAVQVIQEVGPVADHLTIFQRTPNYALPMNQGQVDKQFQDKFKETYPIIFRRRFQTFSGFSYDINPKKTLSVSPEERHLFWEDLWAEGGFRYWLANYSDMFNDQAANDEAYAFWRDKVRARVHDPVMKEKLAPMVAPHPFGTKRPSLEQNYYEIFNQSNVSLLDVNENPIEEITEKGVRTRDGQEHEFDILVLATGFDMVSGGITQIDIRGTDGIAIGKKWGTEGVHTYLGANIPGKVIEPLNFTGGVPYYKKRCDEVAQNGYEGFDKGTVKA
ncbi:hypothetical protein V5O48_004530 [Marasmius crinis-equi]|uniref:Cyclopentanone 1,2-monooxygenase n=1 Tax=Marasmius crinis-equi TaxID=585013 RepID=A0ABR3FQC5_9AGAR